MFLYLKSNFHIGWSGPFRRQREETVCVGSAARALLSLILKSQADVTRVRSVANSEPSFQFGEGTVAGNSPVRAGTRASGTLLDEAIQADTQAIKRVIERMHRAVSIQGKLHQTPGKPRLLTGNQSGIVR